MIRLNDENVELILRQEQQSPFMYGRKDATKEDENEGVRCYVVDLSSHRFYAEMEEDEIMELDWTDDVTSYVKDSKKELMVYLNGKIENNRNVLHSAKQEGNEQEEAKAYKHLNKNVRLLAFITAYEV